MSLRSTEDTHATTTFRRNDERAGVERTDPTVERVLRGERLRTRPPLQIGEDDAIRRLRHLDAPALGCGSKKRPKPERPPRDR